MNAHRAHVVALEDRVVDWRRRLLVRAGFSRELAGTLARDARYDLHALVELTERGCPPPLARRILAPLEPSRRDGRAAGEPRATHPTRTEETP